LINTNNLLIFTKWRILVAKYGAFLFTEIGAYSITDYVKFVSDGPNGKIPKIVLYQPMNEPDLYNLALGDLDSKTGEIDFDIRTNNGDRDMILATITETVYAFLYSRPTYSIHFKGSDSVSTRLYQMAISNYFDKLS